jgi:peptidoglycan/xylan/chitin deacetylase (PgdA/CDA1 family)
MKRQLRRVSLPARLVREVRGILCTRPAKMKWPGGVVSFTFDDFPRSAWINGGAILEKYDVRGTYYTAMGLAGTANHLGPMFEVEDLRAARAHGHEIACHTFTHRDCCRASPGAIIGEIEENAAALSALLDGTVLTNFAYPFGGVSLSAKHALANRFASCRGTGRGINRGTIDLADLFSTSIYNRDFDRARLCQSIDAARKAGGWIIFFTHDVSETPSEFGCTPAQLQSIVSYAVENMPVLPVREVVATLGVAGDRSASSLRAA